MTYPAYYHSFPAHLCHSPTILLNKDHTIQKENIHVPTHTPFLLIYFGVIACYLIYISEPNNHNMIANLVLIF